MGLDQLTWSSALHTWTVAPAAVVLCVLAALAYLWRAYRTVPRAGHRWSAWRTAAFLSGLAVLLLCLQSFIGVYSHSSFSVHMVLHLLLIMVVPVLIILGQPIALLAVGDDRTARVTDRVLDSRTARLLTFPGAGFAIYAAVLVGTHLTNFMQEMLQNPWLHDLEVVLYLVGGYLFFLPLLGHEPLKRSWSYPLRVFLLLMGMTIDTIVGVMLMMVNHPPFPGYAVLNPTWGPAQLLSDIRTGGAIMWVIGDMLMLAVTVMVAREWLGDTERQNDTGAFLEAARRSALAAQTGDASLADAEDIDDDDALEAYNRMLARLHQQDQGR